jgi:TPR repeat protein
MTSKLERDYLDALAAWKKGKYEEAMPVLIRLAETGHARSQRILGIAFQNGWGVESDLPSAMDWFRKADGNGDAAAALYLAMILDPRNDVRYGDQEKNDLEARRLYKRAFHRLEELGNQGDAEAMHFLSDCYSAGWGCEINFEEARRWRTAAERAGGTE